MNVLLFHNVSLFIFFPNRIIYNTNRNGKCSGYHTQFKLKREKHEVHVYFLERHREQRARYKISKISIIRGR